MLEAIRSLSSLQSGHWGIVLDCSTAQSAGEEVCRQLRQERAGLAGYFRCNPDGQLTNVDSGDTFPVSELEQKFNHLIDSSAGSQETRILRCVFTNFETLSVEDQSSILRITRAARETMRDARLQTIVVGAWNFFRIQEHWRRCYHDASPAPDRNHVFCQGPLNPHDIRAELRAAEVLSPLPNDFENTCVEMLFEATGGDRFVFGYVLKSLIAQQQRLDAIESAMAQAMESGEVTEEFGRRTKYLTGDARSLLGNILDNQFVSVRENDTDAEDLRLVGLVHVRRAGAQHVCLSARSVIVDSILRQNWRAWGAGELVYNGKDLARPNAALNTTAYRLISNIETTLRNLLVLSLSCGSSWIDRINQVKTLARDSDGIENELLGLAREILNASVPYIGNVEPVSATANITADAPRVAEENKTKKPRQIPLVDSAKDWRARNHLNTALDFASDSSLVYFITTEGLASILVNEKQGIYPDAIKQFFPNKHELITFLEHYIAIRAAVAHNQPITLGTLRRLQELKENLEKRMYLSHSSVHER